MNRLQYFVTISATLTGAISAQAAFSNQTASSGIVHSYEPGIFFESQYAGGGAVGDFDADGRQDLFLLSGSQGGQADRVYRNQGDGTFVDVAAAWGVTLVHDGKGVSVGDYDDDGHVDLYVTSAGEVPGGTSGKHMLLKNSGASFVDVAPSAGVNFTTQGPGILMPGDGWGSAFGDYDLDGDLDLCVAGFAPNNSGTKLFQNRGDGGFDDVTDAIDLFGGTTLQLRVFAPRFADMDVDGYPELLLAADFGTSAYFRNNTDGTFTDITTQANVGQDENGMGQTVSDFDDDGLLDWYVTSIYLPAANYTGNKLYLNQGNHNYIDTAAASGVDAGGYAWGAVSADFDHNGHVDIAETNGSSGFSFEQSYLWLNAGGAVFTERAIPSGLVHNANGRGMVDFDYDGDGDTDLAIFACGSPVALFRNEAVTPSSTQGSWLRVFLDTTNDPTLAPGGYGTVLRATVGGVTQMRAVLGGDNFISQSELSAHFGLGAATSIDLLEVQWSNGLLTSLENVPVNQTLTLEPPSPWVELDGGSPGTLGTPELTMKGPLLPGTPVLFDVEGLSPGALGAYVVGVSPLSQPFAGGILVPNLDILFPLLANPAGEGSLQLSWPANFAPGTQVWVQAWVLDVGGTSGFASTSGFRGDGN